MDLSFELELSETVLFYVISEAALHIHFLPLMLLRKLINWSSLVLVQLLIED